MSALLAWFFFGIAASPAASPHDTFACMFQADDRFAGRLAVQWEAWNYDDQA